MRRKFVAFTRLTPFPNYPTPPPPPCIQGLWGLIYFSSSSLVSFYQVLALWKNGTWKTSVLEKSLQVTSKGTVQKRCLCVREFQRVEKNCIVWNYFISFHFILAINSAEGDFAATQIGRRRAFNILPYLTHVQFIIERRKTRYLLSQ